MRITLLTMGTRGDTQPFILLAVRLKKEGYDVTLGARPDFAELAKEYDIKFAPLGRPYKSFILDNAKNFESGNFFKIVLQGLKQKKLMFENLGEDAYRASIGSDAIIYKYSWVAGYSISEKLGIPCAAIMPFPYHKTKEFPCFVIGKGKNKGRLLNALLWWISEQIITWQYQRMFDNKLRQKTLKIEPLPFLGPYKRQLKEKLPIFYTFSPIIVPKPSDWPKNTYVTGTWLSPPSLNWNPSSDLLSFLENGTAPVYIGFGSMPSNAEKTLSIILKALELSNRRGIILSGWAGIGNNNKLPETVFCINDIPHYWLFPKMAAIVHHGGAGTTTAGLLSGVPSIITPSTIDQYSWARQVYMLGVSPAPIPFKKLTGELLAEAIIEATTNEKIKNTANEIGKKMELEDGIGKTIEIFKNYYKENSKNNL